MSENKCAASVKIAKEWAINPNTISTVINVKDKKHIHISFFAELSRLSSIFDKLITLSLSSSSERDIEYSFIPF